MFAATGNDVPHSVDTWAVRARSGRGRRRRRARRAHHVSCPRRPCTVPKRGVCGTRPCILPRSPSPARDLALLSCPAACAFEPATNAGSPRVGAIHSPGDRGPPARNTTTRTVRSGFPRLAEGRRVAYKNIVAIPVILVILNVMGSVKPFLHFVISPELLKRVDDFRFRCRFESRAATIKWLLAWALDQGPVPPLQKFGGHPELSDREGD